jgi:hypothetical protein
VPPSIATDQEDFREMNYKKTADRPVASNELAGPGNLSDRPASPVAE